MTASLLSMPRELRLDILSYFIPSRIDISFAPAYSCPTHSNAECPVTKPSRKYQFCVPPVCRADKTWHICNRNKPEEELILDIAVLYVNKQLHAEATALLYETNTFTFTIAVAPQYYGWANHYRIAPCGRPSPRPHNNQVRINTLARFPTEALRRITKAQLVIRDNLSEKKHYLIVKKWMHELVERLQGIGEDRALQELTIELRNGLHAHRGYPQSMKWEFQSDPVNTRIDAGWRPRHILTVLATVETDVHTPFQYCLEPLANLRNMPLIKFEGHVSPSFAAELVAAMQRRGSAGRWEIPRRKYRIEKVMRKRRGIMKRRSVYESMRFFYEPELDWDAAQAEGKWGEPRFETRVCRLHDKQWCRTCRDMKGFKDADLLNQS